MSWRILHTRHTYIYGGRPVKVKAYQRQPWEPPAARHPGSRRLDLKTEGSRILDDPTESTESQYASVLAVAVKNNCSRQK